MLVVVTICILLGCNLDVDTSDPMASETIEKSKENGYFIKEYKAISDSSCDVQEAWIEYTWKYEAHGCNIKKARIANYTQVNLRVKYLPINSDEYLLKYRLEDSTYGIFGTSNGCYVLHLKEENLPAKFKISLYKFSTGLHKIEKEKDLCTIFLIPK